MKKFLLGSEWLKRFGILNLSAGSGLAGIYFVGKNVDHRWEPFSDLTMWQLIFMTAVAMFSGTVLLMYRDYRQSKLDHFAYGFQLGVMLYILVPALVATMVCVYKQVDHGDPVAATVGVQGLIVWLMYLTRPVVDAYRS